MYEKIAICCAEDKLVVAVTVNISQIDATLNQED